MIPYFVHFFKFLKEKNGKTRKIIFLFKGFRKSLNSKSLFIVIGYLPFLKSENSRQCITVFNSSREHFGFFGFPDKGTQHKPNPSHWLRGVRFMLALVTLSGAFAIAQRKCKHFPNPMEPSQSFVRTTQKRTRKGCVRVSM
jgi:hypothetical protein